MFGKRLGNLDIFQNLVDVSVKFKFLTYTLLTEVDNIHQIPVIVIDIRKLVAKDFSEDNQPKIFIKVRDVYDIIIKPTQTN